MNSVPKLEHLFIYTTWECNLHCKHCWVGNAIKTPTLLSVQAINDVINQALLLGLRHIKLSGGEPLLTRTLTHYIIEKAAANNVGVNIETNGTLLNEEWARFFAINGVSVSISLDSANEEEHDTCRGLKGAFRTSLNALDLLYKHSVSAGVVMSVSSMDTRGIDQMVELCLSHHATFLKVNPIVCAGRAAVEYSRFPFMLTPEEMFSIKNRYQSQNYSNFSVKIMLPAGLSTLKHILRAPNNSFTCGNCPTLNMLSVLPNGDLGLCADAEAHTVLRFGNLFKQDISTVWHSNPQLSALRNAIPNQLEGVCSCCIVNSICKGSCRVVAISSGGKITSPHPICQRLADEKKFPLSVPQKES